MFFCCRAQDDSSQPATGNLRSGDVRAERAAQRPSSPSDGNERVRRSPKPPPLASGEDSAQLLGSWHHGHAQSLDPAVGAQADAPGGGDIRVRAVAVGDARTLCRVSCRQKPLARADRRGTMLSAKCFTGTGNEHGLRAWLNAANSSVSLMGFSAGLAALIAVSVSGIRVPAGGRSRASYPHRRSQGTHSCTRIKTWLYPHSGARPRTKKGRKSMISLGLAAFGALACTRIWWVVQQQRKSPSRLFSLIFLESLRAMFRQMYRHGPRPARLKLSRRSSMKVADQERRQASACVTTGISVKPTAIDAQ